MWAALPPGPAAPHAASAGLACAGPGRGGIAAAAAAPGGPGPGPGLGVGSGSGPLPGLRPLLGSRRGPGSRAGPTRCGAEPGGRGPGLPPSEVGAGKEPVPRPGALCTALAPVYGGQGERCRSRLGNVSAGP